MKAMTTTKDVYIASCARTPIAGFTGSFAEIHAPQLGGLVIKEAVLRAGLSAEAVNEVFMGCVLSAGLGQNPARQASIDGGIPSLVPATTINKVCGSGLQSVVLAGRSIRSGDIDIAVAGGMENMTRAPYLLAKARSGYRLGSAEMLDALMHDGLMDAYAQVPMGNYAEACATELGFTREQQDDYAIASNLRARAAIESGAFKAEIVPVQVTRGKETAEVSEDEQPRRFDEQKMRRLRPVFTENGTVTAGNASSINDAAAALVVASRAACEAHGITPVARILGATSAGVAPEWFTLAPVDAVRSLLTKLNLTVADVDLFEINEAFAVVALAAMKRLDIPHEKLNVHGGAVALGHPIGASGARILITLLHALASRGGRIGIAAICIGGGEAIAMAVEML